MKQEIYCEWCGKNPYYIAVYDKLNPNGEICLCEDCYDENDF